MRSLQRRHVQCPRPVPIFQSLDLLKSFFCVPPYHLRRTLTWRYLGHLLCCKVMQYLIFSIFWPFSVESRNRTHRPKIPCRSCSLNSPVVSINTGLWPLWIFNVFYNPLKMPSLSYLLSDAIKKTFDMNWCFLVITVLIVHSSLS